jgi:predicted nucleotidyltransferase
MESECALPREWHQQLLQSLAESLQEDEDIVALGIRGSLLRPEQLDIWSDVDVVLVVRDSALDRFFPALDWLAPLGQIYAYEQFAQDDRWTTRICFEDFRRLDVAITTETELIEADRHSQVLFPGSIRLLFSRSQAATHTLARERLHPIPSRPSPESFQQMSNGFWFKAVVAVTKVARSDLLIALHLTLELLQECCVLGMMLRDRATGTKHHRTGGTGNEIIRELPTVEQPYTALNILDTIEKSGVAFDQFAGEWTDNYAPRHHLLSDYVEWARQSLGKGTKS